MSTPAKQSVLQAPKQVTRIGPMTLQEYLRRERESESKHEYRNGYMVATSSMLAASGDMIRHSSIKVNLIANVVSKLLRTGIQFFESSLRVALPESNSVVYPDASAFHEHIKFMNGEVDVLVNPSAIFEVLSGSTEVYDRGAKFEAYQQVASMRLYVLISQDHPRVEVYERREGGGSQWLYTAYGGMDAIAKLPALGVELPLINLYENVEFPPEDPSLHCHAARNSQRGMQSEK